MRITVIGATVVCGIAFSTPGGALHAEFGESLAGRFRHKLLRKTVRGTSLVADDGVEFFRERWATVDRDRTAYPGQSGSNERGRG